MSTDGSIGDIISRIPHATYDDEARYIVIISDLISQGTLPPIDNWDVTVKDEKAKLVRKKQGQKEAKEAEQLAKELGVWNDFYGSGSTAGKSAPETGKGKAKKNADHPDDHSALQALILKKQKKMDGFFDHLAAKYAEPMSGSSKGKRRERYQDPDLQDPTPHKKLRSTVPSAPDIDDLEFAKLQETLFANKEKATKTSPAPRSKSGKTKGKKGKKT